MRRFLIGAAAIALVGSVIAGRLVSQEKADDKKAVDPGMAYATPGKEHQALVKRAGKWEYKGKFYMAPDAPPTEMKGRSEFKAIMGGRFVLDENEGDGFPEFGGQKFHGLGITGYDNFKKKYVSTWIDDMGTGILVMEGDASPDGKVLTYIGEMPDMMGTTGKKMMKVRSVEKTVDNDHFGFAMYAPGPDGKEMKMFEIDYARRK